MSDETTAKSIHDLPPGFAFDPPMAARLMTRHGHGGWLGLDYRAHGTDWAPGMWPPRSAPSCG